uniref:Putative ovule protein n=1 Tax=Solanum chacoense TaxID=4108 RepID=A0A0V0H5V8_SOLCH
MEFEEIAIKEEIAWRQRSKVQWLKDGDKNTKVFHNLADAHKRYNSIDALEVEGQSITKMPALKMQFKVSTRTYTRRQRKET